MSDANKRKYNIDELVSTLLSERSSEVPAVPEAPQANGAVNEEELLVLESAETTEAVNGEETDEALPQLLDMSAVEDEPVEETESPSKAVAEFPSVTEEKPAPKKRRGLFRRKMEDTAAIEQSWVDYGVQPIGHHREEVVEDAMTQDDRRLDGDAAVRTDAPAEKGVAVDEFPEVKAPAETITMQVVLPSGAAVPRGEEHTRVIPTQDQDKNVGAPAVTAPSVTPTADEQLPDQISLEEIVRVEDIAPEEGMPTT